MANLVGVKNDRPFVVKADRGVRDKRIDVVLDALERLEAKVVYLLSEQVTVE